MSLVIPLLPYSFLVHSKFKTVNKQMKRISVQLLSLDKLSFKSHCFKCIEGLTSNQLIIVKLKVKIIVS